MIAVFAYLCALSVSPAECDRATAVDVLTFPPAPSDLACMRDAQATLAELAIRADAEHRWIVKCRRIINPQKIISEADVRRISDATYTELLGQAVGKGWRYTPEMIESGYRRHFEEFRLQLIDQGYTIVVGEAGA